MTTVGYIVINDQQHPMELAHYHDTPKAGVLMMGDVCTLFTTYARAYGAKDRTRVYAYHHNYDWGVASFKIRRVVSAS